MLTNWTGAVDPLLAVCVAAGLIFVAAETDFSTTGSSTARFLGLSERFEVPPAADVSSSLSSRMRVVVMHTSSTLPSRPPSGLNGRFAQSN